MNSDCLRTTQFVTTKPRNIVMHVNFADPEHVSTWC